jgi:hypothetical protein
LEPVDGAAGQACADGGTAGPSPASGGDGQLEEPVQAAVELVARRCLPEGVPDLVKDLVLPDQSAFEPGGDPEQVDDCRLT